MKQIAGHGNLCYLERDMAAMADDLDYDFDQLLPHQSSTSLGKVRVRLCKGLSDTCRDEVTAAGSVGRCRTSLRGGNRGPGWTGWCRR